MIWPCPHGEQLLKLLGRRILDMVNLYTKYEVSIFSHFRAISGGDKFYNASHDPDHAHFMDDLSSVGWDLL